MIRSSVAVDVMDRKKNKTLSTPYEDTSSVDRVVNKQAMPISQTVVRQFRIKMTARKLCKRNNVLNGGKKKRNVNIEKLQSVYVRLFFIQPARGC